jgi:hypothetical protein
MIHYLGMESSLAGTKTEHRTTSDGVMFCVSSLKKLLLIRRNVQSFATYRHTHACTIDIHRAS